METATSSVHQEQMMSTAMRIQEYIQNHSDDTLQKLLRDFALLGSSSDALLLEISNMKGTQFYTNLRELLLVVESTNPLVWSAVTVLQKACIDYHMGFHSILSDMFVPVLGKLLNDSLPHDKKLRLLQVLQVLTHGIHIQFQAPYLLPMLRSVIALVTSTDAEEASISLSILVNLLHRNPPVKHAFLRCVKTKDFLKQVLCREINSMEFRLEAIKFLMLVGNLSEIYADDKEVKKFIAYTFQTVVESVRSGKMYLAQHAVSFFGDVTKVEKLKPALQLYQFYGIDIDSVLKILEEDDRKQNCELILLDFLGHLVSLLPPPKIVVHIERIVDATAKIISSGDRLRLPCALNVLLLSSKKSVNQTTPEWESLKKALHRIMPILVRLLSEPIPRKDATTVLQLLCEFTKMPTMKKDIISSLDINVLRGFFESFVSEWKPSRSTLGTEDALFYVEALNLISEFVSQGADYLQLFSWLTAQNSVLFAVATALKNGPFSITYEILKLPGKVGFSDGSLSALADCLSQVSCGRVDNMERQNQLSFDTPPLFREEEKAHLDSVLSRLNKPQEMPMSALMTVYQYRIDAGAQEQRMLLSELEMANNRIAQLTSQFEASKDEMQQLRFCLLDLQMKLEQTQVERDASFAAGTAIKADASKAIKQCEEQIRVLKAEKIELQKTIEAQKKTIDEREAELQKQISKLQGLSQDYLNLEVTHKADMRLLQEKDEEIKVKDAQIHELEIIKNAINEITSGKKKVEK